MKKLGFVVLGLVFMPVFFAIIVLGKLSRIAFNNGGTAPYVDELDDDDPGVDVDGES